MSLGTTRRTAPIDLHAVDALANELFSSLPRADQRRWAQVYLRGLLLTQGLLELVVMHASSRATVTCMNDRLQYLGFSGRSYPGWHHHTTLVSAAYAYSRLAYPSRSAVPPFPRSA
ncbi:hypothetical protein AB0C10_05050 [Microbispora amethystogenes]